MAVTECPGRNGESFRSLRQFPDTSFSSIAALAGIWLSAGLIWYGACRSLRTPRIFGDELNYWDMARSFHQGARIPYWSVNYDIPTHLYSFVLSPVFALHELLYAYQAARLVTPFLIAASVFPIYLLSRELVERRYAFAVTILSVAVPGMTYSSTLMTENLFYPLFVGAFWSSYRALCSGRLHDSLLAASFFALSYYTKPHVFVLVLAYTLCAVAWLLWSLWQAPSLAKRQAVGGFVLRLIPVLTFAVALVPRMFALPPDERSMGAILFGGGYQQLLEAHAVLDLRSFLAAWSGLLLSTLVATLFVPFALFVTSAFQLKNMDMPRRMFWLLTGLVWLGYTALAARHTVLNDGSIRIHERYLFMVFPCFFVWYFLVREEQSRRSMAVASAVAIAVGAAIMRWPAHVFLTPHVNTDSPSLTGFLCLSWIYHLSFLWLAVMIAIMGTVAVLVAFSRKVVLQVTAWALILVLVSLGWVEFENRWINPVHVRLQTLALEISSQIGSQATLGVHVESKNWLLRFHLDFWMDRPTILYGIDPASQVPGSFNWKSPYVRRLLRTDNGNLDFGTPAPDYLLSNIEFSEPLFLVDSFPTAADTLYLYRVPQSGGGR